MHAPGYFSAKSRIDLQIFSVLASVINGKAGEATFIEEELVLA